MSPIWRTWTITEYRGRDGLTRLEEDWRRLYAEAPTKSIFQSYDVLVAYADHLMGSTDRLLCLAVSDRDRVRAICPLETVVYRKMGLRLRMWRSPRLLHTQVADVVCPDDELRRRLLPALVAHLRDAPGRLPLLHIGPLPEGSPLWDGLRELGGLGQLSDDGGTEHVMDCGRPFDEIMRGLSKKTRTNLRKARTKLDTLPGVRFETVTSQDDLGQAYETFLDLEASGWKANREVALRLHTEWVEFSRELTRLNGGAGDHCEIHQLYADGRCIASEICVLTGDECAGWRIAYDEAYSPYAPGLLLVQYSLQRYADDPRISRLNWIGSSQWEQRWHPDSVKLQHAHAAVAPWSGPVLLALLRLRNGPGRRALEWLRGRLSQRQRDRLVALRGRTRSIAGPIRSLLTSAERLHRAMREDARTR